MQLIPFPIQGLGIRWLGIVVCDGDCYMLRSSMVGRWHGSSYAPQDVVREFFRRYSSLSFVLVLTIEERLKWVAGLGNLEYRHQLFVNRSARQKVPERIIECLEQLPKFLPTPMRTPMNVRHHLDWQRRTHKWFGYGSIEGGMIMSDSTVKVSARAILDLLSGQENAESFFRQHRLNDFNPFQIMRKEGRLINNVRVEKSEMAEDDDEWLVFEFGDPDPAISPFRNPNC